MTQSMSAKGHSHRFRDAHAEPGCSAPITDIVGSVLTRFIVLSALASIACELLRFGDLRVIITHRCPTVTAAPSKNLGRFSPSARRSGASAKRTTLRPFAIFPGEPESASTNSGFALVLFKDASTCSGHRLD